MVKKIKPIHPGEMLREEFLIPAKLTPKKLAQGINIPVEEVKDILEKKKDLSTDMACRLALYFGMSFDFWLNLQKVYELDCWQQRWAERVKEEVRPLNHSKLT
ncbi:MAG: HigA family addiction module antidote protein [Candidatus Moeniiplasma glomeromycotorum]|nr:HigA family addiction module antidote protein [Candidatus Moeniiplasma glomeromycotorum]